jgi:hypothetical protein
MRRILLGLAVAAGLIAATLGSSFAVRNAAASTCEPPSTLLFYRDLAVEVARVERPELVERLDATASLTTQRERRHRHSHGHSTIRPRSMSTLSAETPRAGCVPRSSASSQWAALHLPG